MFWQVALPANFSQRSGQEIETLLDLGIQITDADFTDAGTKTLALPLEFLDAKLSRACLNERRIDESLGRDVRHSLLCRTSPCLRFGMKSRRIQSTPTETQSMRESDFEVRLKAPATDVSEWWMQ